MDNPRNMNGRFKLLPLTTYHTVLKNVFHRQFNFAVDLLSQFSAKPLALLVFRTGCTKSNALRVLGVLLRLLSKKMCIDTTL